MEAIKHITFSCRNPEKFSWTLLKDKNIGEIYKEISELIVKFSKTEKQMANGLRSALICIAIKAETRYG